MMEKDKQLRVGAAEIDITPTKNVQISGAVAVQRFAQWVMDPLYAKVLIVDNGGKRLCLITADVTIITARATRAMRKRLGEKGYDPSAVMFHVTQTHTAPGLGYFMLDDDFDGVPGDCEWMRGSDMWYLDFVVDSVVATVEKAEQDLENVQVLAGRGIEGRLAFNRRGINRNGHVFMPGRSWQGGVGNTGFSHLEGPMDPEVGVIAFRTADRMIKAILLHHTCHPVCVFPRKVISSDWPGAWCDEMRRRLGPGCVPLVINGCCGNINPWDPFNPAYCDDHRRMGRVLAEMTENILLENEFQEADNTLGFQTVELALPYREIDAGLLEAAEQRLQQQPDVAWLDEARTRIDREWFMAANIASLKLEKEREKQLTYEIQVLRLGDFAIVGLPGEPFVEGQLALKTNSPAQLTLVAHCVGHYVGYVPTKAAFDYPQGCRGHEANSSTWSKLEPDALGKIVDKGLAMLTQMFK